MSFICFKIVDFPDSPAPAPLSAPARTRYLRRQRWLTQQEHFNLISLRHLVALQLILDLLIPLLPLLLLCAHSTAHFG